MVYLQFVSYFIAGSRENEGQSKTGEAMISHSPKENMAHQSSASRREASGFGLCF